MLMKITPNMGKVSRVFYVVLGLVLVAVPFVWTTMPRWEMIVLPILGAVTIATGAVGY